MLYLRRFYNLGRFTYITTLGGFTNDFVKLKNYVVSFPELDFPPELILKTVTDLIHLGYILKSAAVRVMT